MKVAKFARALALVAPLLALGACKGDITEDGAGDPFAITLSAVETSTTVNGAVSVNAQVVDRFRTPLPSAADVTSLDPSVVRVDSVVFIADLQITRAFLKGVAASENGGRIVFTHGSLTDTTTVIVE